MRNASLPSRPIGPSHSSPRGPRSRSGFTLIELLLVITIIAILATMLAPSLKTMSQKADSVSCASNLRAIGVAVQSYLQDHSFYYPEIETDPNNQPVYPPGYGNPQTMVQAFGPYGITTKTMQCPSDIKSPGQGSYGAYGTSYDWKPTLDDETGSNPLVYGRRMGFGVQTTGSNGVAVFSPKLSKVRQVFDDTQIHFGHMNALYADGHVVYFQSPTGH